MWRKCLRRSPQAARVARVDLPQDTGRLGRVRPCWFDVVVIEVNGRFLPIAVLV
jgi:hypothetical protein